MSFQPSGLYEYAATVALASSACLPHGVYDGDTYRLDIDRGKLSRTVKVR